MNKIKKIVISLLIIILVLSIVGIINRKLITNIFDIIKIDETILDFEYNPYYETKDGKIMTLITFRNESGIKIISYFDEQQKENTIECNGKKEVALDFPANNFTHYYFKQISSTGLEKVNDLYLSISTDNSIFEKIDFLNTTENKIISIAGETSQNVKETVNYSIDLIVYNGNLTLDGISEVEGATLSSKVYSFGDSNFDVGSANTDAEKMVVLKVNGNLTINDGVILTSCVSVNGYGGPKGLLIYCTGTLTNNGTISMTARGAKAVGENVYLWKNQDGSYEYVPAVGGTGAAAGYQPPNGTTNGSSGENGINRATGGRGIWTKKLWNWRSWTEMELRILEELEAGGRRI